ncbi:hypothetical protein KM043_009704 [Ampulex compressa]|nr:hypothetical protein KM043_009704 [Ampulex compressa]
MSPRDICTLLLLTAMSNAMSKKHASYDALSELSILASQFSTECPRTINPKYHGGFSLASGLAPNPKGLTGLVDPRGTSDELRMTDARLFSPLLDPAVFGESRGSPLAPSAGTAFVCVTVLGRRSPPTSNRPGNA